MGKLRGSKFRNILSCCW